MLDYRRFGRAGDQSFWGVGLSALFMSLSEQGEADRDDSEMQAFLLGAAARRAQADWDGGGIPPKTPSTRSTRRSLYGTSGST